MLGTTSWLELAPVRNRNARYEFREEGGRGCGNFAIIEVGFVEPEWIKTIPGGHTAIARVSLNGESRTTLKLYTLRPSKSDQWLTKVKTEGMDEDRVFLHGMLTYDYFFMVKALRDRDTGRWAKPSAWQQIEFPIAMVVFGESEVGARREE